MEFWQTGSLRQYAKGLARETEWTMKKRSGNVTAHWKHLGDSVNIQRASSLLPDAEERDDRLSGIVSKAEAGKKLSQEEWDYLRAKNPELYAKLRQVEEEAEGYEKQLRRCKTQDEARRLHVFKLTGILAAAKEGDGSALLRLNRMKRTAIEFSKSREYRKLPTEAEEAAEREVRRQERAEALREKAAEEAREAAPETEKPETAAETEPETGPETQTTPETGKTGEAPAPLFPKPHAELEQRTDAARPKSPETSPALAAGQRAYAQTAAVEARAPRRRTVDKKA